MVEEWGPDMTQAGQNGWMGNSSIAAATIVVMIMIMMQYYSSDTLDTSQLHDVIGSACN